MKTEYLFVILLVLIGFSSCEDSTSDTTLELSQSTFENISSNGATLTVNITCCCTSSLLANADGFLDSAGSNDNCHISFGFIQVSFHKTRRVRSVDIYLKKYNTFFKIEI